MKTNSLDSLRKKVLTLSCPTGHKPTFGEGTPHSKLVLIAESPSSLDERSGRPFTGSIGRLLDYYLERFGLEEKDIWITYAVKCRTIRRRNGRTYDRPPSVEEIEQWRPILLDELSQIKPNVILCLGRSAARALLGREVTIHDVHGKVFQQENGAKVLVTYHPSYLLCERGGPHLNETNDFSRDLALAVEMAGLARPGAHEENAMDLAHFEEMKAVLKQDADDLATCSDNS